MPYIFYTGMFSLRAMIRYISSGLVPMLVANLSAFFMIACNLQVGRIFMGIRISVLQRSENVRVDKGRVENMKKKKPGPFGGERTGLYNQFVNHL